MTRPSIGESEYSSSNRSSPDFRVTPSILQRSFPHEGGFTPIFHTEVIRSNVIKQINIGLLAEELGVEAKYFTYTPGEIEASSALFKTFSEQIEEVEEGETVMMSPELSKIMADTFEGLEHISFLPFFIEISTSKDELWKKTTFFKYWLLHLFEYDSNARIAFLRNFRERFEARECIDDDIKKFIISKCQIDFYGLNVELFVYQLKEVIEINPYLSWLQDELREIEDWLARFLAQVSNDKGYDYIRDLQNSFWSETELPMITFLVQNKGVNSLGDKHFIAYFDRFLCHANTPYFTRFMAEIFHHKNGYLSRVKAWAIARKDLLLAQEENETQRVFCKIFGLRGRLFENGRLNTALNSREFAQLINILGSLRPSSVSDISEKVRGSLGRTIQKNIPKTPKIGSHVIAVPEATSPAPNEKNIVGYPLRGIFKFSGEKKQIEGLDLSGIDVPDGTVIQFERQLPKIKTFETISVEIGKLNEIPAIVGQDNKGHFIYRLTVILPGEYRFPDGKTKTILEHKIYAEADPTPDEINARESQRQSHHTVRTAPVPVIPVVQERVSALVETMPTLPKQKTLADTMTAWELAIQEGSITPELRDDGVVIFHLPDEFVDELHDASFEVLQISPDSTIHPDIGVGDFASQLQDIARDLREKKQAEYDLALQVEQEEKEYQMLREQFQPFYDFIGEQTFVDKNNTKLFDAASKEFHTTLNLLGWTMPWRLTKDGQIKFETIHKNSEDRIKMTYNNIGNILTILRKGRTLSRAEERCYTEIAEAFSHLALFYTAEYRERQKMITKEKKFQKDTLKEVEAYEALLDEGRGRIVQYSSGGKGRIYVSKFPLDDKPHMLAEKVGHATVEKSLQENENSELCYRRDIVRINGEIGENAGEQSVENTHQNLLDLRQSPRARFILRKRILITLGYEKFLGDDRRPIQPEKDGKKKTSAFEILQSLKAQKNIESKEQIDEEFMDSYIDLLIQHRIRVQYVWPLSVSLADHRKQLEKIRKQKKQPTAD